MVNSPKQPVHGTLKYTVHFVLRCFKRDHEKVNLIFPLHPVPIYWQDHKKQKWCGISYQFLLELQNVQINWFFGWPFESGNCGKKRKKPAKYLISQERKELFRRNKNHFSLFLKCFLLTKYKKIVLNLSIQIYINVDLIKVR